MIKAARAMMVVVATDNELPEEARVWGSGSWIGPENRQALDWLALGRLLGWRVAVARSRNDLAQLGGPSWIVLPGRPDSVSQEIVDTIGQMVETTATVVLTRAASRGFALAKLTGAFRGHETFSGQQMDWTGPGDRREWRLSTTIEASRVKVRTDVEVWARLEGAPLITARRVGSGTAVSLAFNPGRARDRAGGVGALLQHLLTRGPMDPVAWLDWRGTLVLRLDDPGGSQNVHCRDWCYPKLDVPAWTELGMVLERRAARLSIGYTPGWVDDGDAKRGRLHVSGRSVARRPGRIHPSPLVRYEDTDGHAPGRVYDYDAEYRGIQLLRVRGCAEVEMHGYTHLHSDTPGWACAADRYDNVKWYRDFSRDSMTFVAGVAPRQRPISRGLELLKDYFSVRPTTLIVPGFEFTDDALHHAIDAGIQLVSDYYLAMRHCDRLCWCTHMVAVQLEEPAEAWFDGGLPVVSYFHDRDIVDHGVGWVDDWLREWIHAGARRLIDFRMLAAAVGRRLRIEGKGDQARLVVEVVEGPDLPAAPPLGIYYPDGQLPESLDVAVNGGQTRMRISTQGQGWGRAELPVAD